MRVEYINPFIESVSELFATMLSSKAKRGDVTLTNKGRETMSLVAIIGLSGPARGTVALSFPVDTVFRVVGRLLGDEPTEVTEDVTDTVAEMANIIAGGAKARLINSDTPAIDLGLPTVGAGADYQVMHPSQAAWLEIPFTSDLGDFVLRVTFEFEKQ